MREWGRQEGERGVDLKRKGRERLEESWKIGEKKARAERVNG